MKTKVSPLLVIVLVALALGGIGLLVWKFGGSSPGEAPPEIVKPANPDDPKYRPDPKLGLGGGGV